LDTRVRTQGTPPNALVSAIFVLTLLYAFLCGVRGIGLGFRDPGDVLGSFFSATRNPFVALALGILGTTLVRSSAVTTAVVVAMVAAPANPLPIANAIPMLMGANLGTTAANTIVALAHVGRPDEFRRAFAAATCFDFFNLMAIAVMLPLELLFHPLQKSSAVVAAWVAPSGELSWPNPVNAVVQLVVDPIDQGLGSLFADAQVASAVLVALSAGAVFITLHSLVRVLWRLAGGRAQVYVSRAVDANPYTGMGVGAVVTVMLQSSSVTTSVLVPLAAAGIVTLGKAFPVTLGANVGTSVTSILASSAAPAASAAHAIQVAAVHCLFTLVAVLMIYPFPAFRSLPMRAANRLAVVGAKSKRRAILYVLGLFYGVPALLVLVSVVL
jgi:solute carrier family 34 (sodium-dependent phosphate cotransporter)